MQEDNVDDLLLELVLLVHPAKSSHQVASSMELMALCLEHTLTRAVEEPAFISCAIRISLAFSSE